MLLICHLGWVMLSVLRMAICSVGLGFHQFIGTGLGSGEIRKTRLGSGRVSDDIFARDLLCAPRLLRNALR